MAISMCWFDSNSKKEVRNVEAMWMQNYSYVTAFQRELTSQVVKSNELFPIMNYKTIAIEK